MNATVYRYAYDRSGRTFTESQWIDKAYPHFIREPYDTEGTYIFFLASVFQSHLRDQTIVEADYTEDDRPLPFQKIGCPICSRRHVLSENASLPANTDHSPYHAGHYRRWALKE